MEPEELALFDRYHAGDIQARNDLIERFAYVVYYVAGKLHQRLADTVELDDLVSYGTFGLIDALRRFDLERGVKFSTYAVPRIRGAIIDEIRALDWVPRSIRAQARKLDSAHERLEGELQRMPTDAELADTLAIQSHEISRLRADVISGAVLGFEGMSADDDSDLSLMDVIADPGSDPTAGMNEHELRLALVDCVETLDERERTVVALHYVEGLTLAQVGSVLQVTESRVCQIHTRAISRIRSARHEG